MVGGKGQKKKKQSNKLIGGKEPEPRSRVGEGNSPEGTPCDAYTGRLRMKEVFFWRLYWPCTEIFSNISRF